VCDARALTNFEAHQIVPYDARSPEGRACYLEWNDGGRRASEVPPSFLRTFLAGLEHAIVRDGVRTDLSEVRGELTRLAELHKKDRAFVRCANQLIAACEFLDPDFVPELYASANSNHRNAMPFRVRHFLGSMLARTGHLEAEPALVFYLQQPQTRLEPFLAQYFRELLALWCQGYWQLGAGMFGDQQSIPPLTFDYEPLMGEFGKQWVSELPDLGQVAVPPALHRLFEACRQSLLPLEGQPVGRILNNVPVLPSFEQRETYELSAKRDWREALKGMVEGRSSTIVSVADLLTSAFEGGRVKPNKLLSKRDCEQVARLLDDCAVGYEPDPRFGLPNCLRPDGRIVLFNADRHLEQAWTEAYRMVQAAVVVSQLGQLWWPRLPAFDLQEVEARLPHRYRLSDVEISRLRATGVAISSVKEPRKFLARWLRNLAREKRLNDVATGFGIAFKGHRRNGDLAKLARALTLECPQPLDVDELLAAASTSIDSSKVPFSNLSTRVSLLANEPEAKGPPLCSSDEKPTEHGSGVISLLGLEAPYAEILLALSDRARTRPEFEELARSRRLSVAGAIDVINEWSLTRLNAVALHDDETVALSATVADYLRQRGA
jgi:hypothetical protein